MKTADRKLKIETQSLLFLKEVLAARGYTPYPQGWTKFTGRNYHWVVPAHNGKNWVAEIET